MSVTADDVKAYREKTGVGMQDARRTLERADRNARLARLRRRMDKFDLHPSDIVEVIDIIREMNT